MYVPAHVTTRPITRGDYYEDCHFHPMLCLSADGGNLVGVSLVSGEVGVCNARCAAVPMDVDEAIERKLTWEEFAADLAERPAAIHWECIEG